MSATTPLITPDELDTLRRDGNRVVVLDASVEREPTAHGARYVPGGAAFARDGHVPGALHADLLGAFADTDSTLQFTAPTATGFVAAVGALGVHRADRVVVYDRYDGTWAARLWWNLRAYGHGSVSVLDGGLDGWIASGRNLEHGGARPTASGTDHTTESVARAIAAASVPAFVGRDAVLAALAPGSSTVVVCGLRPEVYSGEKAGGFPRPGHITGSRNLPYAELVDRPTRRFRPSAARFATDLGPPDTRVITYCGGGVNGAGVAFALHLAGWDAVSVYDGSFAEWSADPSLPVSTGDAPGTVTDIEDRHSAAGKEA